MISCDTKNIYQMLKSVSCEPIEVGKVLLEHKGRFIPDNSLRKCWWEEYIKELLSHATLLFFKNEHTCNGATSM